MKDKSKLFSQAYVERDVSWMYFNHRILQEAAKTRVPLLERLGFLGIYSNNLDEFFRVRVAALNRIIECEDRVIDKERHQAQTIFKEINRLNVVYSKQFEKVFSDIIQDLENEGIKIVTELQLSESQQNYVKHLYHSKLNGSIYPIFLNQIKQLGELSDDDIYLAVRMTRTIGLKGNKYEYALIEMPVKEFGRFITMEDGYVMFLDDVIRFCLPMIFAGMDYESFECYTFKFTKDAEMEVENEIRTGVLEKVSKGVKSRRRGMPVRLVYDSTMPKALLKLLINKLGIDKNDTRVPGGRYHNLKDMMRFPDCGRTDLKYPPRPQLFKPELEQGSVLNQIRSQDCYLHFPYHSFNTYLRVLRQAAISKDVKSIKTTLYRLAKDSHVIKALICAAKNGKQVTVVIELFARFDEASNISWAKQMQDAGITVIFGVEGLKVHSKITHISSRNGDIACISTGNFHEGNARVYTDLILMTANKAITREVDSVFSFIERPYTPKVFRHLLVSPNDMRRKIVAMINTEIRNAKSGKKAYIKAKINHITDRGIVKKLYEASQAGVQIDLLVRGNCSLRPGIPRFSDNMRIVGIIDRYLEHSRIIIFGNGGEEKVYIGSADWMTRNLDTRIEVYTPVYDPRIIANLHQIIDFGMRDNQQGRIVDGAGRNIAYGSVDDEPFCSQDELYNLYKKEIDNE